MLDGYRRLPLRSVGRSANFYADTLFLQIPESTISRLRRTAAPSRRSKMVSALHSYSHEMIHYHQFVGTRAGYILRLIMAARDRLRFLGLKDASAASLSRLSAVRRSNGPLVRRTANGRPIIANELRDAFGDAVLQLILWLDAAERFMMVSDDFDQRLFASGPEVFRHIIDACGQLAFNSDDPDLEAMLDPIAEQGRHAFDAGKPVWASPASLMLIVEAQSVVNQAAFMGSFPRRLDQLFDAWSRSPEYLLLISTIIESEFPGENIQSWRVHGAIALLVEAVLDGWIAPTGSGPVRWSTPRHLFGVALHAPIPWAKIMDTPLNTWSTQELAQKRELIAQTLEDSVDFAGKDDDPSLAAALTLPEIPGNANGLPTMMGQFSKLRSRSLEARRIDFAAAILPGEALLLAPDRVEDSGFIEAMACPFMLLGDRGYTSLTDQSDYVRWSLISLVEQATYAFLTDVRYQPAGLSKDELAGFKDAVLLHAPFLEPCFQ